LTVIWLSLDIGASLSYWARHYDRKRAGLEETDSPGSGPLRRIVTAIRRLGRFAKARAGKGLFDQY
jgi:hypothetical protein